MSRRIAAGSLWFLAIVAFGNLLALTLGVPRELGPIAAFVVTALIVADPANLIWPVQVSQRRPATRIPDAAVVAAK